MIKGKARHFHHWAKGKGRRLEFESFSLEYGELKSMAAIGRARREIRLGLVMDFTSMKSRDPHHIHNVRQPARQGPEALQGNFVHILQNFHFSLNLLNPTFIFCRPPG